MASAFVEQALVPILEIVAKGINVTVTSCNVENNGSKNKNENKMDTQQFPEMYIRSIATDLLSCTTSILESKEPPRVIGKDQVGMKSKLSSSSSSSSSSRFGDHNLASMICIASVLK